MRLTVFDIQNIDRTKYKKSLKRALLGRSLGDEPNRDTWVAIYNGSVLAIASSVDGCLDFFNVIDVTRGRGVGDFLAKETASAIKRKSLQPKIAERLVSNPILKKFLESRGFSSI